MHQSIMEFKVISCSLRSESDLRVSVECCVCGPELVSNLAIMDEKKEKRVNSLLNIHYTLDSLSYDTLSSSSSAYTSLYTHHPSFTHQLFDNEMILLSSNELDPQIDFYVNIHDLSSDLIIRHANTETETLIREKITPLLSPTLTTTQTSDISSEILSIDEIFHKKSLDSFVFAEELYEYHLMTSQDTGAENILKRFEKIAMWYIETASPIDFNDEKWEVLYLVKTNPQNQKILLGYITLYTFHNPFSGSKLRVCQALILPLFQGKGFGQKMLFKVYEIAEHRSHVTEITVEDPAESFQNLRDVVDMEWYRHHLSLCDESSTATNTLTAEKLKIIPQQMNFILSALEYCQLINSQHRHDSGSHHSDSHRETQTETEIPNEISGNLKKRTLEEMTRERQSKEEREESENHPIDGSNLMVTAVTATVVRKEKELKEKMKEFRLKNKRYLLQQNSELKGLSKSRIQEELQELYNHLEERFRRVSKRVNRPSR